MVSLLPDSRRSPWRGGRLISHTRCPCLRRKRARPIPYEPVPSTPKATSRPPDRRTGPCASAPPAAPRRRARPEAWWSAAAGRWSRPHRTPGTPPRSPHRHHVHHPGAVGGAHHLARTPGRPNRIVVPSELTRGPSAFGSNPPSASRGHGPFSPKPRSSQDHVLLPPQDQRANIAAAHRTFSYRPADALDALTVA